MFYVKNILIALIVIGLLVTFLYVETKAMEAWEFFNHPETLCLYITGIILIIICGFVLGTTGQFGFRLDIRVLIIQLFIVLLYIIINLLVQPPWISLGSIILNNFFTNPSVKTVIYVWLGMIIGALYAKYLMNKSEK